MRAALAIVMLAAAASSALACFQPDFDDVASGGSIVAQIGAGPGKIVIKAVPSRPSFYYHRGTDDPRPPPTFTEDDGTPIAVVPVYTGIPEYPIRYDLAITSGTDVNTQFAHVRFEVSPGMTLVVDSKQQAQARTRQTLDGKPGGSDHSGVCGSGSSRPARIARRQVLPGNGGWVAPRTNHGVRMPNICLTAQMLLRR